MGRGGVVLAVADHRRSSGAPPSSPISPSRWPGSGFLTAKRSPPAIPSKSGNSPRPSSTVMGCVLRLVGADRGAIAAPSQRRQGFGHPRIRPGQPGRIGFVELRGSAAARRRLGRIGAARRERAGDQRRRAVADHVLDLRQRQRRAAALAQHLVERGPQIGRAVDSVPSRSKTSKNVSSPQVCVARRALCNDLRRRRKPDRSAAGVDIPATTCARLCYNLQQSVCCNTALRGTTMRLRRLRCRSSCR